MKIVLQGWGLGSPWRTWRAAKGCSYHLVRQEGFHPNPGEVSASPSRMAPTESTEPLPSGVVPGIQDTASPDQRPPSPELPPRLHPGPAFLAPGVDVTALSRTVRLYRPPGSLSGSRPLVLLLPWFGAQPRALARYLSLYLGRHWPVLVADSTLEHFLWPRWGLAYAARVLGLLREGTALGTQPLLIHAFSIGGYTFAQMMVHLASHPEQHAGLRERICGLIYDSLVAGSLADMARGVAQMSSSSAALRPLIRRGTLLYFSLFRRCTVPYYEAALDVFHHPPLCCPVLVFYCHNDPLSDIRVMEQLLDTWRAARIPVHVQEWQVSRHAAHLRLYPQEYTRALDAFLQQLDLAPSKLLAKL